MGSYHGFKGFQTFSHAKSIYRQTGINIAKAEVRGIPDRKALHAFELMVANVDDLSRLMRSLTRVRGVMRVERLRA